MRKPKIRKCCKGIEMLVGFLLGLAGIVLCMCETCSMDEQLMIELTGFGMVAVGVLLGRLGKGAEPDEVH